MSVESRRRLAKIVRHPDCDLAEAALLICVEGEPDLDVEVELLRLDALADGLRTRGFSPEAPDHDAAALARYLAEKQGFTGDEQTYHDPRNALLTRVLDRKRGLPITLSIVYIAIARRLDVPAFGIGLPGHFVTGIGGDDRPVVLDPFHDGRRLEDPELAARVREATDGQLEFRRAMLRPSPAPAVVRRILNNLTRDFVNQGDLQSALWSLDLKLLLPNRVPDDLRARGELLSNLGRYRRAAESYEAYVDEAPDAEDRDEIVTLAIRARAKMN